MIKKATAVFSAFVLLFTAAFVPAYGANSKDDIEQEIEDLENKIDGYDEKLASIANDKSKQEEYLEELQEQIKAYDRQIALYDEQILPLTKEIETLDAKITELNSQISALDKEIADIDAQIQEQKVQIDKTYELLKKRLRATYMAGETSELEIFLNATDFEDFLTRTELLRKVAEHDNSVVKGLEALIASQQKNLEDLNTKKADVEAKRKEIEDDRAQVNAKRNEEQSKKSAVDKKRAQSASKANLANSIIGNLNQQSAKYESLKAKAEKELIQFANELDNWIKDNASTGTGENVDNGSTTHNFKKSSRGYISPLQDKTVYYSRNFATHSAQGTASVDLVAPLNRVVGGKTYNTSKTAPIYAVASGKVITSTYKGSTYGNYVTIDHGNGITSLYAHCDSRMVSVGDRVVQGQVIATVGNTGNVYPRPSSSNPVAGSHLHFEMRLNGNRVNPENYLPSPLIYK